MFILRRPSGERVVLRRKKAGHDMSKEVEAIAGRLKGLTPDERLAFLADLKEATGFCWKCGFDCNGVCHCQNDE